jgi:hypothetical protein
MYLQTCIDTSMEPANWVLAQLVFLLRMFSLSFVWGMRSNVWATGICCIRAESPVISVSLQQQRSHLFINCESINSEHIFFFNDSPWGGEAISGKFRCPLREFSKYIVSLSNGMWLWGNSCGRKIMLKEKAMETEPQEEPSSAWSFGTFDDQSREIPHLRCFKPLSLW